MSNTRKCLGTNRDNGPCSATPRPGRDYCQWHAPDLAADRARWQAEGGRAKSNANRARKQVLAAGLELDDIHRILCKVLLDVVTLQTEPGVGTAAATIARSIATIRQASDLEARIVALEERTGQRKGTA